MTKLNDLPADHVLRNTPIGELNCTIQWDQGGAHKKVFPQWKICKHTFNELGISWTEHTYWFTNKEE